MKNFSPSISVLLPAYNAGRFIGEAIDSILAQTLADFEFIIINDGSTDNTAEIVRVYKDPRIVFVDNEKNQGLISVLNQGLNMACGEYVARMDADDIAYPERFAKQAAFMDANPEVGVVAAGMRVFGGKFGELGDARNRIARNPPFVGALDWFRDCQASHPTVMLRREVFERHRLRYDPDYIACEDYELWSRAVRYAKIANIPEILLNYRCHDDSITVRQRDIQLANRKRVRENVLDFCLYDGKDKLAYRFLAGGNEDALCVKVRLFRFIPFLKIVAKRNAKRMYLFDLIPVMKIRNHTAYLFFLFPIATVGEVECQT